ncbi:ATP-dependent endonuclease [Rhizobium ruizarguesonis]
MQLIKKIEISYLRSLYRATLPNAGDLNIIFGRNDSGKSNVLRALSLFFNGVVDTFDDLDFDLDVSDVRPGQARKTKDRLAIWIKITFLVPPNYRRSLGDEITVRRQWNRDGAMSERVWPADLTSVQLAQVTKLLNRVDFTYIPGIKDNSIYADLIERMYIAAAKTTTLRKATDDFISAIQGQTTALSSTLTSLFKSPSRLAAPAEMSSLFRTLDFAHGEEGHSLLRQKGDGIKARHLPELLRFINENESEAKIFIWGFEEPENSLDLGAADAEAKRFAEFSARPDTQIFITSHSPVFYLAGDHGSAIIRRFFVSKQRPDGTGEQMLPSDAVASIDNLDGAEEKMEEAGLLQLPFVIRRLADLHEERAKLREERQELANKLARLSRPTIFVEGKHDIALYSNAIARLGYNKRQYDIRPLNGTPKSGQLLRSILRDGERLGGVPTFFVLDNDRAGRQSFQDLVGVKASANVAEINSDISVMILPLTPDFLKFMARYELRDDQIFFTAEFLFPVSDAAALCSELVEAANSRQNSIENTIHGDYFKGLAQSKALKLAQEHAGTADWFFARGVPDSLKETFERKAREKKLSTVNVDSVAQHIVNHLFR